MRYYAIHSPRGFGNENNIYVFASKKARDESGMEAITRKEASR